LHFDDTPGKLLDGSEPPPSVQQSFERSSMVFVGTVSNNWADEFGRFAARFRPLQRWIGDRRVRWEVKESLRGMQESHVIVSTGYSGCTFAFHPGETYLVYAIEDVSSGELYTSSCMRTVPASRMSQDLTTLRTQKRTGRF
jgi:hypothetical protein